MTSVDSQKPSEDDFIDGFLHAPRYRSTWISSVLPLIATRGRCGAGNQDSHENEIDQLDAHPDVVASFECDWDRTYMNFVYVIPSNKYELWKKHYHEGITEENIEEEDEVLAHSHLDSYPKDHEVHLIDKVVTQVLRDKY